MVRAARSLLREFHLKGTRASAAHGGLVTYAARVGVMSLLTTFAVLSVVGRVDVATATGAGAGAGAMSVLALALVIRFARRRLAMRGSSSAVQLASHVGACHRIFGPLALRH